MSHSLQLNAAVGDGGEQERPPDVTFVAAQRCIFALHKFKFIVVPFYFKIYKASELKAY